MTKDIVFASNNRGKIAEAQQILTPFGFRVLSPSDLDIKDFSPVENGETFSENAIIKAKTLLGMLPEACIFADDSGLEVDALGGRPGIFSARYCGENATEDDLLRKILEEMRDVPDGKRTARFVCSVAFYCKQFNFGLTAYCEGTIAHQPAGTNGFGYDPIFIKNGKTFAEISQEEKNNLSHRAGAFTRMAQVLNDAVKNGMFLGSQGM